MVRAMVGLSAHTTVNTLVPFTVAFVSATKYGYSV